MASQRVLSRYSERLRNDLGGSKAIRKALSQCRCPSNHVLVLPTVPARRECDLCFTDISPDDWRIWCETCDHDVCITCAESKVVTILTASMPPHEAHEIRSQMRDESVRLGMTAAAGSSTGGSGSSAAAAGSSAGGSGSSAAAAGSSAGGPGSSAAAAGSSAGGSGSAPFVMLAVPGSAHKRKFIDLKSQAKVPELFQMVFARKEVRVRHFSDPYSRPEHQYHDGPVRARPGEEQSYGWGRLVVQPLPRPIGPDLPSSSLCSGCHYALGDAPKTRCQRCQRLFHAHAEPSCFGDAVSEDVGGASSPPFCVECLPRGPPELKQRLGRLNIVYDFERRGFTVVKIEKIENPRLTEVYNCSKALMMARMGGDATRLNEQMRYHLSSSGWGHLCETGLDVERASVGLFGKALYFSPDPQKCDDYWRKATSTSDGGAVSVASTGKDPLTTRVMFACRVLLGSTFHYSAQKHDRALCAPPDGYDSVAGEINGKSEMALYASDRVLLDYIITYELPKERALRQSQARDQKQLQQHQKQLQQFQQQQQKLLELERNFFKQPNEAQSDAFESDRTRVNFARVADITQWRPLSSDAAALASLGGTDCSVCLEPLTDEPLHENFGQTPVVLGRCHNHAFHVACVVPCFKPPPPVGIPPLDVYADQWTLPALSGHVECALCKQVYGVRTGDAPAAHARLDFSDDTLPETESDGYFRLHVHVPSGKQLSNHPSPGHHFAGKDVIAYFPHTADGAGARVVLRVLEAYRRRLLFTIGQSATTGKNNTVKFASIHFKTRREGGAANHGFPDPGYLERVSKELEDVGVTDADVMGFLNDSDEEQKARGVKLSVSACIALSKLPGPTTESRCVSGHPLTRGCIAWRGTCDRCAKEFSAGQATFRCADCDFDLCAQCAGVLSIVAD